MGAIGTGEVVEQKEALSGTANGLPGDCEHGDEVLLIRVDNGVPAE